MAHAVGLHPQRHVQSRFGNILEIVCAIEIGCAIHIGSTNQLKRLEVFVVVVFGAIEHQVFEQMRKPGFAGFLVFRADVIPDVDSHDRCLGVFVDDQAQTVIECVLGEIDLEVLRCSIEGHERHGDKRHY